ncbi:CYTH domain-containing protein [Microbacterium immunditiarum]|uniref:CYTH domain-containing protein n=1 Tax=Microbacterium immunditiarum TaxID=337480 RepID=UPI0015C91A6A|nr:CYTH domain-containing protein [Microbacterium immunditiarum]
MKFDVADDTPLPDLSSLPGAAAVSAPEPRELDSRYFDSDEYALGRAGYAVRRRTGGPDEGWHVKGPRDAEGARVELHWPLGAEGEIPDAVTAAVAHVSVSRLTFIARILNNRTASYLLDDAGGVVAEFVDDRVTATDVRRGTSASWREWEFELGPAAPTDATGRSRLLSAATEAVAAVGGRIAASDSKLGRTLGL